MVDMLHCDTSCSRERTVAQLKELVRAYGEYKGTTFSKEKFLQAFHPKREQGIRTLQVLGARMGNELFQMTQDAMPLLVVNETCVNNRSVGTALPEKIWTLISSWNGMRRNFFTDPVHAHDGSWHVNSFIRIHL